MARKTPQLPAVPATVAGDLYGFLSAVRERLQLLDTQLTDVSDSLIEALKYSSGNAYDNGKKSASMSWTPLPKNGAFQRVQNGGAHTLRPPAENCTIFLLYENVASAGAITITGFTKVVGTSAPPSNSTTAAQFFLAKITVVQKRSLLEWQALQ